MTELLIGGIDCFGMCALLLIECQDALYKITSNFSLEATVDQACSRNGEILCKRCYSRFFILLPPPVLTCPHL